MRRRVNPERAVGGAISPNESSAVSSAGEAGTGRERSSATRSSEGAKSGSTGTTSRRRSAGVASNGIAAIASATSEGPPSRASSPARFGEAGGGTAIGSDTGAAGASTGRGGSTTSRRSGPDDEIEPLDELRGALESILRARGERPGQGLPEHDALLGRDIGAERAILLTGADGPAAGQQFMRDGGERVHVGARVPRRAGRQPFGRRIRAAERRRDAGGLERRADPEPGDVHVGAAGVDDQIARVERPMTQPGGRRGGEGGRDRREQTERLVERQRRRVTQPGVERLAGDERERDERARAFEPRGGGHHDRRVRRRASGQGAEAAGDAGHHFGRDVQLKDFDRDEPVGLAIERAKNRAEHATANLVKHAVRAERGRRAGGVVERQRTSSISRSSHRNMAAAVRDQTAVVD